MKMVLMQFRGRNGYLYSSPTAPLRLTRFWRCQLSSVKAPIVRCLGHLGKIIWSLIHVYRFCLIKLISQAGAMCYVISKTINIQSHGSCSASLLRCQICGISASQSQIIAVELVKVKSLAYNWQFCFSHSWLTDNCLLKAAQMQYTGVSGI